MLGKKSSSGSRDNLNPVRSNDKLTRENHGVKGNIRLYLQILIYFDSWFFIVWILSTATHLFIKFPDLGNLTKFLSLSVLLALIVIECIRLYLSYLGNLSCRVPELAGFWMISVLLQLPMISYFVFNPFLLNKPAEATLHIVKFVNIVLQIIFGYLVLKATASVAKRHYLSQSQLTIATRVSDGN